MNKKNIIFSILLTTLLFTGCGSKDTSDGNHPTTDTNTAIDSSASQDMDTTLESTTPANTMEPQNNIDTDNNPSGTIDSTMNQTNDTTNSNATMITEQEAKQIALKKVPGATENDIKKFKKDTDDSIMEYEGELHYNGMEYEFEINAYDGTILEWDEEPIKETVR